MQCRFCPSCKESGVGTEDAAGGGDYISLHEPADFANGIPLAEVVLELCSGPAPNEDDKDADVGPQQICTERCLPRLRDCFLFRQQVRQAEERWRTNEKINLKIEIYDNEDGSSEYETEFLVYEEEVQGEAESVQGSKDEAESFVLPPKEMIRTRLEYNNFDYIEFEGEKCCGCEAFLASREDLEAHVEKVHRNCDQTGEGREWHCSTCGKGYDGEGDLGKHQQQFQSKHIFLCKLCLAGFYWKDEFMAHVDDHQREDDEYEPSSSTSHAELDERPTTDGDDDVQMKDKVDRKRHGQRFLSKLPDQSLLSSVDDYEQYQIIHVDDAERCCGCGEYFGSFEQLMDHARQKHQSGQEVTENGTFCEICFETFKAPWALNAHKSHCRYVKELFYCKLCQAVYVKKFHLMKHFASTPGHTAITGIVNNSEAVATSEPPAEVKTKFCCCFLKCSEMFKTEKDLLIHVDEFHAPRRQLNKTERPSESHVCSVCERSFASRHLLILHRNRSAMKKHMCSFCAESFILPSKLREHELLFHSGPAPAHSCDVCDKSFRTKHLLKSHRQTHDQERNFPCDQCSAVFRVRPQLTKHIRGVHPTCFPYHCAFCEKKFSTKPKHDLHLRSHTGEKPYPCRYDCCERQFAHVSDRKRHEMAVHTSERPYQCEQCPAAYIRKRELVVHQQRHRIRVANIGNVVEG
ncbi:zinc finger protein 271-like [Aedes albopictus]|uniref:C2H2-type domain-containing protein n=1 Tax=Aedes albopictus TaxID=7160 RepID=A0ABM1YMF6_AEDAL